MKKRIIKVYLGVAILFVCLGLLFTEKVSTVYAEGYQTTAYLRADVIVTKYRYYHGKRQYRRWNKTDGKWVDPKWININ